MSKYHSLSGEQPREKLLTYSPKLLSDAELLAILLRTGQTHLPARELAEQLLNQYDGLRGLIRHLPYHYPAMKGLGKAKTTTILAAVELGRRLTLPHIKPGEALKCPKKAQHYLAAHLSQQPNEVFACLFLDTHCRLLKYEELFQGTINEANVYPREIIRRGLYLNAAKVILAHNHPSGNSEPSAADIAITQLIQEALAVMDIDLLDHIIIGHPKHFSFAKAYLL